MVSIKLILSELKGHFPFTFAGTGFGVVILALFSYFKVSESVSGKLFEISHPLHVFFSAIVTTAMYRLHSRANAVKIIMIGFVGSVGIGTISDCLIPFLGEWLLGLPHSHMHIGFVELWWLVNPLAFLGIAIAFWRPRTKLPHSGHVFLSTAASLFHISMAMGTESDSIKLLLIGFFLFIAVWLPCCTSDIIFPLVFAQRGCKVNRRPHHPSSE